MPGLLAAAVSWGLFWGAWSALLPGIKAELSLTDQQLGLSLFAIPVAAVPAMLLTGPLAHRLAQYTLPVVTALFGVSVLLVGLARSQAAFVGALLLLGASSGGVEVGLNATLGAQEARDGRRLFNKVHAATPLAMVVAAPAAGLARYLGASPQAVLTAVAVLVGLSAVLAIDGRGWEEPPPVADRRRRMTGLLLALGAVGAVALLMENSVEQWGAIHLVQQLGAGPLLASFGPAAYMAGLSAGRMLAQWQGARLSDGTLVSVGGAVGGAGLAVGAAAWNVPWAVAGYVVAGCGLAPVVPTLLSAVGRSVEPGRRARTISAVTTVSYAGFLASPPLVGTLAGAVGLSTALAAVALGGVLVAAGGRLLGRLPAGPTGGDV
ncbi:MFS transporter [Streptomyces sp. CB01881]|uniref:MFS transporter n=1 Tax=Streptomyces sp. CB01881 TaxID=2078691 RepID=UPI000CDCAC96|nr:MFS transporter [Streptomyces sp. CB01881]AUY48248.1 MFS transporter [Streptomyces sp. CB01881]TYC76739.1 MFS transporter [Streptomyces sp. CB01881]